MLSERAKSLKPSPTLALAAKAKELTAAGKDVISLSVGEPDWDTFESIKKVGVEAIQSGATKYSPANGIPELRKAIAKQLKGDLGIDYEIEQVTVTSGAKFVIFAALQMIVNSGDEVIIPAPYWVSYPTMVELASGMPRVVESNEATKFKLSAEQLREHIGPKTKAVIFNSPSNPTGNMYSTEELSALAEVLRENPHVLILADDIYNRLVFNEQGVAPNLLQVAPDLKDRTIIINGCSKTYSMTGWRIGWAVGPKDIIGAMNKYQSQSVSCACTFAQLAAVEAIENGDEELKKSLVELKKRRDFVFEQLLTVQGIKVEPPDGAFYIWPNIKSYFGKSFNGEKIKTSKDFAKHLLEDQMVVAVPGSEFGTEGYLRLSYALSQERMGEAVQRLKAFVAKLS